MKSTEDHGYILDMGIQDVSGFLSFKDSAKGPMGDGKLYIGRLLQVTVSKLSSNGRTCTVSVEPGAVASAFVSDIRRPAR